MPGFFDPVAASFVRSIIADSGGYTLFDLAEMLVYSRASVGTFSENVDLGDGLPNLSLQPRSYIILMEGYKVSVPIDSESIFRINMNNGALVRLFYVAAPANFTKEQRHNLTCCVPADGLEHEIELFSNPAGGSATIRLWRLGVTF